MPLVNDSDQFFYLNRDGKVIEGGEAAPAEAVTLLVAPGGQLDEATARAHGIEGLRNYSDLTFTNPATGEEYLHVAGRAVAPHLATAPPPSRVAPNRASHLAAPKTNAPQRGTVAVEEKAVGGLTVETKAVERAPENKSGFAQPPAQAPRAADRK